MMFHEDTLNGFQVTERKRFCDGQTVCLFMFGFYGPVNNEVMSSRSVNSGTVPGQA